MLPWRHTAAVVFDDTNAVIASRDEQVVVINGFQSLYVSLHAGNTGAKFALAKMPLKTQPPKQTGDAARLLQN